MTDEYFYTAFGEELSHTGTTVNGFRYVGEQWDANAAMYNLRARLYNPENGRFTSVDPEEGNEESPISLNQYLYANVNPISFSDPSGEYIFDLATANLAINLSTTLAVQPMPVLGVKPWKAKFEVNVVEYGTKQQIEPSPYQANIFVTCGLLFASVTGSSWPNPYFPKSPRKAYHKDYAGIDDGEYPAYYDEKGHHGKDGKITPAIILKGQVPTIAPNIKHGGQYFADDIQIHVGYSADLRGSANCITIKPGQEQNVWRILTNGQKGVVTVRRISGPWVSITP